MNTDTFTEVTYESWFGRMGKAVSGVVGGVILVALAIGLLFWNEGRSVRRYQTLDAGQHQVVAIAADGIDSRHEGRLVHLSGPVTVSQPLTDREFGLRLSALRLQRVVEMYQWTEAKQTKSRKKVGGGKEKTTTYTYQKRWVDHWVDHRRFRQTAGHGNPAEMPYANQDFISINAHLGGFRLTPTLVQRLKGFEDVDIDEALIPDNAPPGAVRHGAWFYFGPQPGTPRVGDVRVSFRAIYPTVVSVVAQQQKNRLTPYKAVGGGELALVKQGNHSAEALFEGARKSNATLTWGLRLFGALLMGIGFYLILSPLATAADVIPLLGSIVGLGAGIAAALLAAGLSLTLIAVAWVWHRPLLGVALLAGGALLLGLLWWKANRPSRPQQGVQPPAPPREGAGASIPIPPPPPEASAAQIPVEAFPLPQTPLTAVDHLKEGIAHLRAKELEAALAAFSTAIQKDAELGSAYYFRGIVQSRRHEMSAAIKNLQIAARLGHGKAREALSARRIAW
ncbi:MAG: TMEM43 family protein [Desulfosarcinaceae bacterium]|nr:TMEM43 family protein [Desulfosarcinaceae bacterium]